MRLFIRTPIFEFALIALIGGVVDGVGVAAFNTADVEFIEEALRDESLEKDLLLLRVSSCDVVGVGGGELEVVELVADDDDDVGRGGGNGNVVGLSQFICIILYGEDEAYGGCSFVSNVGQL